MPWNVSGFCPQTLAFAPNVEHWDTRSVEKPLPIWLLPSTACKLEGGKRGSRTTVTRTEPIVITIGNFDGVHIGHQRLMHQLQNTAQQLISKPVLITFSPHTLIVVRPDIDVRYLTTLEEKLALAKKYGGIADSIVINFTPAVAAISAGEFMQELSAHFNIKGMVVGTNFSLGHNRMGNVAFLQ